MDKINFETMTKETRKVHVGQNILFIRELKGIKQDALATELGITQQAVSKLEQSEEIDEEKLVKIAKVLGVSVDVLKTINREAMFSNVGCSFSDNAIAFHTVYQNNALDKLIEVMEENKRLYERLIEEKDKVISLYQKLYSAS